MRRLQQVRHLVNDDVFEKVLRFLHEFCVKPDVSSAVVATSPLGFHPLQKIGRHIHFELRLPSFDDCRNNRVEERFVPRVLYLGAFFRITARADG